MDKTSEKLEIGLRGLGKLQIGLWNVKMREIVHIAHLGRHLEFPSEHKEHIPGLLLCVSIPFWASSVKKLACSDFV